jgi:hypothetical protein
VEVCRKRELAEHNLALAADAEQFRAVSKVFDHLRRQEQALDDQLRAARQEAGPARNSTVSDVDAALATLDRLAPLAEEPENLASVGALFARLNARLFFRFGPAKWGKRTVNRVSGGVVTFGATPAPVPLYDGPTGRRALSGCPELPSAVGREVSRRGQEPQVPGREGDSFRNGSRADWI